jgi:predicted ATP-grasp superfamily ATP-dependent carboligase
MATILTVPAEASTLGVIDALQSVKEHRVITADASEFASGLFRDSVTGYTIPRIDAGEDAYVRALLDIIDQENVDILIPGTERDVLAIGRNFEAFEDAVTLLMPGLDRLTVASDGLDSVRLAEAAGIPVPSTYETPGEARADDASLPLFVKPRQVEGGRGARNVETWDELDYFFERLQEQYGSPVIQEHIPGGTGSMHVVGLLYDRDGRQTTSFTCRSCRTNFSWGGGGVVGEPVNRPDLIKLATAVIEELGGWVGPINMEFKIDSRTGEPTFIEINPRLWGYTHVATINGINFPARLVDLCLGRSVEPHHELGGSQILLIDSVENVI